MAKPVFTQLLLKWNKTQSRPMPWKGEKNPYLIWLSEIILQQTRVEQGLPYFERFKSTFPTVHHLANAPEDKVMKLWEGLGYYSRARNLHATAKRISQELKGVFPSTYADILTLKGVGPYTAAAIASFAFDLPHAVVDGNVYRVLSRFYNNNEPIDTTKGKVAFTELAQTLLDAKAPGVYNQAIMDFGATVCVPKSPDCPSCPMSKSCQAFAKNTVDQLPVKSKKLVRKKRFFNYLVLKDEKENTVINKRQEKDIWRNLYEFPMIETTDMATLEELQNTSSWKNWLPGSVGNIMPSKPFSQALTHRQIIAVFWEISVKNVKQFPIHEAFLPMPWQELKDFAFPKIIDCYIKDNSLYLRLS